MANEPRTFQEAVIYFSDLDNCISYLVSRRWPNGVVCPTCGRTDAKYIPLRRVWQCKSRHPKSQFSAKIGTIMEDSPLGLDKWLPAMWQIANCRNGVSSHELARSLGVTQKTAWFMLHRIRLAMQDDLTGGDLEGEIEVDETFIGGKVRNMHRVRKARVQKNGRNLANKTVVLGILERAGKRSGRVRAAVVPDRTKPSIKPIVESNIAKGSTVYSDEFGHTWMNRDAYEHQIINHLEAYVKGNVHTNGIENFWSLLKRGIGGTYVSVEPFHLFRYVDEQAFRFNLRKDDDGNVIPDSKRFSTMVSQVVNRRLTYAELTGKEGETKA